MNTHSGLPIKCVPLHKSMSQLLTSTASSHSGQSWCQGQICRLSFGSFFGGVRIVGGGQRSRDQLNDTTWWGTLLRKPFPANYTTFIDHSLLSLCGARLITWTLYSKINHLYNKGLEYQVRNTTCCSGASVQTLTPSERCLIAVHGSVFGRKLAIFWVLGFNHSCWRLLIIVLERLVPGTQPASANSASFHRKRAVT